MPCLRGGAAVAVVGDVAAVADTLDLLGEPYLTVNAACMPAW